MSDLAERVRATGLLAGRAVVLLSGGQDSACVLDLAVRLCGAHAVQALHLDYGLRAASAADASACAELCEQLGVALRVERPGRPAAGNVQAWARDARYAAAARLARATDGRVVTGHTASDQAETVLYRLAASPGRRALLGMPARDGRLVRPLLAAGVTRAQTAAYCRARGLRYVTDASNASDAYARGRVRGRLLDALRAIHPAAEANVLSTAAILRDEAQVLEAVVAEVLARAGRPPRVDALAVLDPALARLALQALADAAAGGRAPAVGARAAEVWALGARGGEAALDLGAGLRAVVRYGALTVEQAAGAARPAAPPAPACLRVPGIARFGDGVLIAEPVAATALEDGILAADALAPELDVRTWREGDRMRPLGMGGRSQSLQDLFINRRVPRARRHRLPVVLSGGEIAWIPGVATGERFRARDAAGPRVRLTWRAGYAAPRMARDAAIGEILVQADELRHRVRALGREISHDYAGKDLVLIGVLKGAVFFLADLMREIDIPCEVDFMAVASYGSATESSGVVRILKDLDAVIEGRHVLIVEDIVDSGLTLHYLLRTLRARGPALLEVCALLTKPARRTVDLPTRYIGFEIPDKFAIGYGLDYAERHRNLPFVAALDPASLDGDAGAPPT